MPIIDQTKPNRTPVRTLLKLVAGGQFAEIFRVLLQKAMTARRLLTPPRAPYVRLLKIHPGLRRYLQQKYIRDVLSEYYDVPKTKNYSDDKLRVGLVLTDGHVRPRSSAFIRLISPLSSDTVSQKISLSLFPENTTDIKDVDVCIVQRTAYDSVEIAQQLVDNLKQSNIKLVVDSDDGFHSIDSTHPEHDELRSRINAFDYLLEQANEVWFSTQLIANTHKDIGHKISVVPNSLDERVWRKNPPTGTAVGNSKMQFVYMGTATHDSDLLLILPALDELHRLHPDSFSLGVIGVSDTLPERSWMYPIAPNRGSIYPRFVEWFTSLEQFDFGLSPLVDSSFNRRKSDIKCLDYIAAGIVPIVSDIEPYKSEDLDNFVIRPKNTTKDWLNTLEVLVADTRKVRTKNIQRIKFGQKYIWQKRNAKDIGEALYKRLTDLLN